MWYPEVGRHQQQFTVTYIIVSHSGQANVAPRQLRKLFCCPRSAPGDSITHRVIEVGHQPDIQLAPMIDPRVDSRSAIAHVIV